MKRYFTVICISVALVMVNFASACQTITKSFPYEVSLKQATKITGSTFPYPLYLPQGFEVVGIYYTEHSGQNDRMVILISDNLGANVSVLSKEELSNPSETVEMMMYIRKGMVLGIKLIGEWYDIGSTKGVLLPGKNVNDLLWNLSYLKGKATYEIDLEAIKQIPTEELLNIARSVPQ